MNATRGFRDGKAICSPFMCSVRSEGVAEPSEDHTWHARVNVVVILPRRKEQCKGV